MPALAAAEAGVLEDLMFESPATTEAALERLRKKDAEAGRPLRRGLVEWPASLAARQQAPSEGPSGGGSSAVASGGVGGGYAEAAAAAVESPEVRRALAAWTKRGPAQRGFLTTFLFTFVLIQIYSQKFGDFPGLS